MTDYTIRAQKFIDQIAPFLTDCDTIREFAHAVTAFNTIYHRKVIFAHGLTRIALITSDYVVKFDYGRKNDIIIFGGCQNEMNMYQQAQNEGYAHLFAKITLVTHNNRNYYVMPRVYGIGRYEEDVYDYVNDDDREWLYDHVFDIHNANYGWYKGYPIIFDYAACN